MPQALGGTPPCCSELTLNLPRRQASITTGMAAEQVFLQLVMRSQAPPGLHIVAAPSLDVELMNNSSCPPQNPVFSRGISR